MAAAIERSTMRKVYWRLLPMALLTYFLCYLDRINVGFASLTMNKDLGLNAAIFGMAAGAFFWGYVIFEVPSNIVLEKVGARIWIARIMVTWGLFATLTAASVGPWSFATVRFLLGVAEAGLYPGIVLYLTYWFPERHRGRVMAGFTLALPVAVALGAPISTSLLELNGVMGLAGWKWMYIAEGLPTVLIGITVLFYFTDRPSQARWLTDEERAWLCAEIDGERLRIESHAKLSIARSFWDPKVLLLALNYFGIVTASLGLLLFLPQMVKQLGFSNMQVGWVTMIPYTLGAISMALWGWISDRMGERRWNLFWGCMLAGIGLLIAGATTGTYWSLVGMSIATIGLYGTKGPFWSMPAMFLTGTAAASGIAWINSIGNMGGFFGPQHRRLGQGPHRQLLGRRLCARGLRLHVGDRVGRLAQHPQPQRVRRARQRASRVARGSAMPRLALALAIAALGAASAHAETTLRVGKASATAFAMLPAVVADAEGMFTKHGVNVQIVDFGGGAKMHQAMAAGSIDIGIGSGAELAMVAKGSPELAICNTAGPPLFIGIAVPFEFAAA